jgi:allophanate hydrolase subunit 2
VPDLPAEVVLPARAGPRADWFAPAALDLLGSRPYEVTAASNRVGLRLSGATLRAAGDRELPTEGLVEGALQVPPNGQPIVMLADHPVTGGYPVIAVVDEAAIPFAAQARPGDRIRFRVT